MLAGPRSVVGARRRGWPRHGVLIALAIVLLLTLAPFLVVTINAVKTPSDYAEHGPIALPRALDLTSIGDFWRRVDFTRKLLNSFVVSGAVAVLGVALSVMNAYALGIGKLRGRSWFLLFFLAANLVPQEALVYPLYYLSKLAHLYDSLLPLSVFHFDTFWMREFHWCDFEWDRRAFPDPAGMLARLERRGLRTCVWINPYIAQQSALFDEGVAGGYFLRKPDGDVWQTDLWQAGMAIVDFTNPAARAWFAGKLRALLAMGVSCFKTDFGERIPTDVVYFDGSDPERMHNYYTQLYNETVFELLIEQRGTGEAVVFARSATAGGQRFPVHWGGDSTTTFASMAETLRGGLSLAMCGFGFWSHDIGGFDGPPDPAVFKRWIAFGLLSSHSRLHGHRSYRVPWLFDEESVDVLRKFLALKHRLMPYLFGAAVAAHRGGIPVMRPMALEFPDDPACTHLEHQYMLGSDLLVAPVFCAEGDVAYYVPDGRWTDLLRGNVVDGPRWVRERHGFDSVPLLVRPGAVIPMGARDDRPDYDYAAGVTLRIHELLDGAQATTSVPTTTGDVGAAFTIARHGRELRLDRTGPPAPWRALLVGRRARSASNGALTSTPDGALVALDPAAARAIIELDDPSPPVP